MDRSMEGFGVIRERENPRFVREEISSGGGAGWRVRERAADEREREREKEMGK